MSDFGFSGFCLTQNHRIEEWNSRVRRARRRFYLVGSPTGSHPHVHGLWHWHDAVLSARRKSERDKRDSKDVFHGSWG